MAEQTFRSPGFFEREIDLTQRTVEIEGVPAGIIGTATQGPAYDRDWETNISIHFFV